jgi:hypothetical protein
MIDTAFLCPNASSWFAYRAFTGYYLFSKITIYLTSCHVRLSTQTLDPKHHDSDVTAMKHEQCNMRYGLAPAENWVRDWRWWRWQQSRISSGPLFSVSTIFSWVADCGEWQFTRCDRTETKSRTSHSNGFFAEISLRVISQHFSRLQWKFWRYNYSGKVASPRWPLMIDQDHIFIIIEEARTAFLNPGLDNRAYSIKGTKRKFLFRHDRGISWCQ